MFAGLKSKFAELKANKKVREQFLKYLFVGILSAVVEFGLFAVGDKVLKLPIFISNSVAMFFSVTLNFILTRFWTFKSENPNAKETIRSLVYFLLLYIVNTTISSVSISMLVVAGTPSLLAKFIMMALVVAWNFILYRTIIFKDKTTVGQCK